MKTPIRYVDAVRAVLHHLETTQQEAAGAAADLAVHALRHRGAVFCSSIGHGIEGDFINRAGGLAALQRFSHQFSVREPLPAALAGRTTPADAEPAREGIRLAVRCSKLQPDDVMVIGSVSGRNVAPVELALACRERGIRVIGLTSFAYTARVESAHPSGQRLRDVSDVALDIGAPYGDAALSIEGYDIPVCPVSGVGLDVAGWMIWERVMAGMAKAGTPATVFLSVNREGGQDYYQEALKRYAEQGY